MALDTSKVTLGDFQRYFVKLTGELITWAYSNGFEMTEGEGKRSQMQAQYNALHGTGIASSNHIIQLAHDWNIFKDGKWLSGVNDFPDLVAYWKILDPICCWGGDFKDASGNPKPDTDHFSFRYQGRE